MQRVQGGWDLVIAPMQTIFVHKFLQESFIAWHPLLAGEQKAFSGASAITSLFHILMF